MLLELWCFGVGVGVVGVVWWVFVSVMCGVSVMSGWVGVGVGVGVAGVGLGLTRSKGSSVGLAQGYVFGFGGLRFARGFSVLCLRILQSLGFFFWVCVLLRPLQCAFGRRELVLC